MKNIKVLVTIFFMIITLGISIPCMAQGDDEGYNNVTYEEIEDGKKKEVTEEEAAPVLADSPTTEAIVFNFSPTSETTEKVTSEEPEETTEEETTLLEEATSFSVDGNSTLKDDFNNDKSKEFLTITTDSGNSFFIVIDRSGTTENVYLLSKVDEYDLKDFVETTAEEVTTEEIPQVIIPDEVKEEKESKVVKKKSNSSMIIIVVVVVFGIGYYLIKNKGKKDKNKFVDENMEDEEIEESYEDDEE